MQYLVLVEGHALANKKTTVVCKYLLEDVVCRYGCVGKIVADRGELDARKTMELFERLGVKFSRATAYNPEANGKIELGHGTIVKVIVRALTGESGTGHDCCPMPCGSTELRIVL